MKHELQFHQELWSFELDESFRVQILDFSVMFWRAKQAIYVSLQGDENVSLFQERVRKDVPAESEVFEFQQNRLMKFGFLVLQEKETASYWQFTTYSFSTLSYALLVYEFDDRKSLDWALNCWKSVECQPAE